MRFGVILVVVLVGVTLLLSTQSCWVGKNQSVDSRIPLPIDETAEIVILENWDRHVLLSFINRSNSPIFKNYEERGKEGMYWVSHRLYCSVNENDEQEETPEADATLKRQTLQPGAQLIFEVEYIPKEATKCRVTLAYDIDVKAISIRDNTVVENRGDKLTPEERRIVEASVRYASVTFRITK